MKYLKNLFNFNRKTRKPASSGILTEAGMRLIALGASSKYRGVYTSAVLYKR